MILNFFQQHGKKIAVSTAASFVGGHILKNYYTSTTTNSDASVALKSDEGKSTIASFEPYSFINYHWYKALPMPAMDEVVNSELAELKNGKKLPEATVEDIMYMLSSKLDKIDQGEEERLHHSLFGYWGQYRHEALIELFYNCKRDSYCFSNSAVWRLTTSGLLNEDGKIEDNVRDVVLSTIIIDGEMVRLQNPYKYQPSMQNIKLKNGACLPLAKIKEYICILTNASEVSQFGLQDLLVQCKGGHFSYIQPEQPGSLDMLYDEFEHDSKTSGRVGWYRYKNAPPKEGVRDVLLSAAIENGAWLPWNKRVTIGSPIPEINPQVKCKHRI